jgi:hypothetical protein
MQRIDENTYIDESLVICAEYQLFIDEMRAQGKYYQPDHWTSFEYTAGCAREPILGVRFTDALTFCNWLTKRESGGWKYRLPNMEEAHTFPLKPTGKNSLGYWLNGYYLMTWIGPVPANARAIDFTPDPIGEKVLNNAIRLGFSRASSRAVDLDFTVDLTKDLSFTHALNSRSPRDRIRIRALARDLNLIQAINNDRPNDIVIAGTQAFKHNRDTARALLRYINLDRANMENRSFVIARTLGCAIDLATSLHYASGSPSERALELARDLSLAIYVDYFTLQERISGRSGAFEGIRLVKERVKLAPLPL